MSAVFPSLQNKIKTAIQYSWRCCCLSRRMNFVSVYQVRISGHIIFWNIAREDSTSLAVRSQWHFCSEHEGGIVSTWIAYWVFPQNYFIVECHVCKYLVESVCLGWNDLILMCMELWKCQDVQYIYIYVFSNLNVYI